MNTASFRTAFPRQLRCWTIHCTLNALPSFCIALVALKLWKSPAAVAAMLCAIATFILLYATLTSLKGPLADEKHVLFRALKLGTKVRAWISGLSLSVALTPLVIVSPDLWSGVLAIGLLNACGTLLTGKSNLIFCFETGEGMWFSSEFFPVYITTMLEGFILSFLLLMISFFAVIFLQARDRKRVFAVAEPLLRDDG